MYEFQKFRETGELSDIIVVVENEEFHLHKFPLFIKSDFFKALARCEMADKNRVELAHFPGGKETFRLVADYCYSIDIGLDATNVVQLRCAAEFLQMTSPGNLVSDTNRVLFEILRSVENIAEILFNCCRLGVSAEQAGVVARCISAITEVWIISDELPEVLLEQFIHWPPEWFGKLVVTARDSVVPHKRVTVAVKRYLWAFLAEHKEKIDLILSDDTLLAREINEGPNEQLNESVDSSAEAFCLSSAEPCQTSDHTAASKRQSRLSRVLSNCPDSDENDTTFSPEISAEQIRSVIDLLILELPTSASLEDVVDSEWACLILRVAAYLQCKCYHRLVKVAAELVESIDAKHLRTIHPDLLVDIAEYCCSEGSTQPVAVCRVVDEYLWEQVKSKSLDPSTLLTVAQAVPHDFRQTHDDLFLVVEQFLYDKGAEFTDEIKSQLLDAVDFHRLSETTLQKAAEKRVVPLEYVVNSSLALCNRLRSELHNTRAALRQKEAEIQKLYSSASACKGTWHGEDKEFLNVYPHEDNGLYLQLTRVIPESAAYVTITDSKQVIARLATCGTIQRSEGVSSLFLFSPFENQLLEIQSSIDALTQEEVVTVKKCYKKVEQSGAYWPFSPG